MWPCGCLHFVTHVLSWWMSYDVWILFSILITLLGKSKVFLFLLFRLLLVCMLSCHGLFARPVGVIGRLCFVIEALHGHLHYILLFLLLLLLLWCLLTRTGLR